MRKVNAETVLSVLPHLFFVYYFSLSIHYYQQRLFYSDNAYLLYRILQGKSFAIFHHRWIGLFTQWLPVIGIKLHCSMSTISIAYSISLALIYYAVFTWIYYGWKQKTYALSILILLGLLQHFAFYWQVSEINTGMPVFLVLIWLTKESVNTKNKVKLSLTSSLCALLILFIHPILSIVWVACLGLLFIYFKDKNYLIALIIAVFILILKITFLSGFESSKIHPLDIASYKWETIKSSYLYYSFKEMLQHQFKIFMLLYLVFLLGILYRRKFILAISTIINFIFFFLLIYYYLPNGAIVDYMETYFIVMMIPILILMLLELDKLKEDYKRIATALIIGLCIYGLFKTKSEKLYKNRLVYLEFLLQKTESLSYIENGGLQDNVVMLAWAMPYETLLKSTADGQSKSVYYNEHQLKISEIQDTSVFLGADWEQYIVLNKLNPKYFKVKPAKYLQISGK